jgi:hypothetical protein
MKNENQNEIVTVDLSKFGFREIDMAAKLLKEYANNEPQDISDGVTLNLNMNSGKVFLSDEDYNCFLLTDHDKIEQWHNCPYCGHEGFKADMEHEPQDKECNEYMNQLFFSFLKQEGE